MDFCNGVWLMKSMCKINELLPTVDFIKMMATFHEIHYYGTYFPSVLSMKYIDLIYRFKVRFLMIIALEKKIETIVSCIRNGSNRITFN